MRKNIYCTIDTETIGGAIKPKGMYNIGGIIHDKGGEIYATFSILVMEHFDSIRYDDYAKKNFHLYTERLESGKMTAVSTEMEAIEIVRNLCKRYGVKYLMAYNSAFDFTKTACRELLTDFEFIDIYLMALQTITHQKKYKKFCSEYNLLSSSKKTYSTTAETVYRYIANDPEFVEEHTAFSDAEIEMQIFMRCDKMHKPYSRNTHARFGKNKCYPRPPKAIGV